jgi:hypothetical protein
VEGKLSVNSGIAPPTSTAVEYIFELSPGSEVNRSKKNRKQRPLLLMEKEEEKTASDLVHRLHKQQRGHHSPWPTKRTNNTTNNQPMDIPTYKCVVKVSPKDCEEEKEGEVRQRKNGR